MNILSPIWQNKTTGTGTPAVATPTCHIDIVEHDSQLRLTNFIFSRQKSSDLEPKQIAYPIVMNRDYSDMPDLIEEEPTQNLRWTKNVGNIFELSQVFFPINIGGRHWVLVVANMETKCIYYRDSLAGDGNIYTSTIKRYIIEKWQEVMGTVMTEQEQDGWVEISVVSDNYSP